MSIDDKKFQELRRDVRHDFFNSMKSAATTRIDQRYLFNFYQQMASQGSVPALKDTGYRVFSEFEEDGKILFLFAVLGIHNNTFIDLGSANGISSNCANLAFNFGWYGLFVDGDERRIREGESYYKNHPDTRLFPPVFVNSKITRENVNELIGNAGFEGEVDFMSVDLDGYDYWVWDALEIINPRVVMIETHIEFGMNNIVVPYDSEYEYPGIHPEYHGASPVAMKKLAEKKGYRLVGANNYGFNTIYVRNGLREDLIPEVSVESILTHPRNKERYKVFEEIRDFEYVTPIE